MNDLISREAAIDAFWKLDVEIRPSAINAIIEMLKQLPSMQDEIASAVAAVIEQPEEDCDSCKYGYFGDQLCDTCRVGYPSHYERRTDETD